jgi:hypothetical protein
LACQPLGGTHAVELDADCRSANRASRIICGLYAALTEDPLFAGFDDPYREARHRGSIVSLNLAVV